MSTPTPPQGPGQMPPGAPPHGRPVAARPQPPKRGGVRGLLIGAGVTVAVVSVAIGLSALSDDTDKTKTSEVAATTSASPSPAALAKASEVEVAACNFAANVANIDTPPDIDALPECKPLNGDQRQAVRAGLPEPGVSGGGVEGVPLPAPKGVTVSGDASDVIRIRSFKAKANGLGWFAPVLRLQNTGHAGEDFEYIDVKVTALRGEDVIATADGIIETIEGGQTITTEPVSSDDFPSSTKGLTYEVELGS